MKIFNQLSNAVLPATGSTVPADSGQGVGQDSLQGSLQGSFQGTFAAVIGATADAAGKLGNSKMTHSQNVEDKNTSGSESKKTNHSSGQDDATPASQAAGVVAQPIPATSLVSQVFVRQVVVPQGSEGAGAANNVVTSSQPAVTLAGAENHVATAGPLSGLPTAPEAAAPGKAADQTVSIPSTSLPQGKSDGTQAAPSLKTELTAPAASTAQSVPSVHAIPSTETTQTPLVKSQVGPVNGSNPQPASSVDSSAPQGSSGANELSLTSTRDAVAQPGVSSQGLTSENQASTIDPQSIPTAVDSSKQQAHSAVSTQPLQAGVPPIEIATKAVPVVPAHPVEGSALAQSAQPAREVVSAAALQSDPVALSVPAPVPDPAAPVQSKFAPPIAPVNHIASSATPGGAFAPIATPAAAPAPPAATLTPAPVLALVPAAAPPATPAVTPTPAAGATSAPTPAAPATPDIADPLALVQQVTATSLAVSQQSVMQSASVPVTSGSMSGFKMPSTKTAAQGVSNQGLAVSKGRTASADSRSRGASDSTVDTTSSTDAADSSAAPRVVTPDGGPREVVSNAKGALDNAALAQSTQLAPAAVTASPAPAHSASPLDAGAAADKALPQPTVSADGLPSTQALSSAQLIQSVHGSEMKLGMQSAEFGNISINTSLNRQALSAQISIDHAALGNALAFHLPAMTEKLGNAYGLEAKVELRDTGSNSGLNDSGSKESRGDRRPQGGNSGTFTGAPQGPIGPLTSSNYASTSASSSRLDIRI